MQAQQSSTSPTHRTPPHSSPRVNDDRSDHPLPTQAPPLTQYEDQGEDADYDATQAIVPSSEVDEQDDYMQDMRRPDGFAGEQRDDRMEYPQDYSQYQQHYQGEGPDYRQPTPISEHGEGAVALYGQGVQGRRDEYDVNPYATHGQGTGRRDLQNYASVGLPDQVEEPDSQMPIDHNPYQTQASTKYQGETQIPAQADLNSRGATERAQGQFVQPQSRDSNVLQQASRNGEHVGLENIGGRRILTKQATAGRRSQVEDFDENEDIGMREEIKIEEFDPTAEIKKFDGKKVLVENWDKIQAEIGPYLKQYAEGKLKNCFDEIFYVCSLFYQLNEDARKDLEEGVEKIVAEEKKQEAFRKVIVDFSSQMQAVAAALSQFGGASGEANGANGDA